MSKTKTDKTIDFFKERSKRIHDIKEKRLQEVHNAFEKAFTLPSSKKPKRKKNK